MVQRRNLFADQKYCLHRALSVEKESGQHTRTLQREINYFVLGIGIISCILLIRYQYILYDVVYSTGELSGVSAGLRLVTATMLLILFGFLTFKYRYMKQENDTCF